ncbi:hypothetical protein [Pseudonocardia sp. MH-G8]|uniref:DUF7455 domain-containing protein n=1 Tax=Pseudonocardia sp. MH-G8 TaxID=1854588 RepID=UPI00117A39E8|nr:hypothetical protein [Pseudonocardia sp. MH-G8]
MALPEHCDRCPAVARVRAELPFGELLFCTHHARAHEDRLRTLGARLRIPATAPPLPPVRSRRSHDPAVPR